MQPYSCRTQPSRSAGSVSHTASDHIITSFHLERDDLDMAPFDGKGGLGQMYELFGERMDSVTNELNEGLAA